MIFLRTICLSFKIIHFQFSGFQSVNAYFEKFNTNFEKFDTNLKSQTNLPCAHKSFPRPHRAPEIMETVPCFLKNIKYCVFELFIFLIMDEAGHLIFLMDHLRTRHIQIPPQVPEDMPCGFAQVSS